MIYESFYWKKELYNCYLTLAKFRHLKRKGEQSFVKAEKSIMIGAYIIRKLDDAGKIPPDFLESVVKLGYFPVIEKGTIVDRWNWVRIEDHYNMQLNTELEKEWRYVINQIIHSFAFAFLYDDQDRLDGFLLNSDNTKMAHLLYLPLKDLLTFFLKISEGGIIESKYERKIYGDSIQKLGESKLKWAKYGYAYDFNLEEHVARTMNGEIYVRQTRLY